MSIKGLAIVTLGSAALALAGYASTSSAARVTLLNPVYEETGMLVGGSVKSGGTTSTPTRPPGRSLYRPGPRNPITSLE